MRKEAILTVNLMFSGIPQFPENGLDPLDKGELERWWKANGAEQRDLLLIADMKRPRQTNFGDVEMFIEGEKALHVAPAKLEPILKLELERLEYYALVGNERAASEVRRGFNSTTCRSETEHLITAMQTGQYNAPTVDDLQILKLCPADNTLVPLITNFAHRTNFLFLRYGAFEVLNEWQNTSFDPFEIVK